ncbi:hypothetical protein O7630_12190 [Micromonospora sp. WMMD718]|uniref:hypothetical protein n=1 Tax=Micromonospora sp. WMMD718 TaxID=3016098 RepID=UPI002416C968|nr:hypothetical protein [Micromonospora sp. WMMD718]MDG4751703.1 hypothetical protein [Micromonospora sp. WMMD718]
MRHCEWCDAPLPEESRAHRRFCSDSHRARASEERRRLAGQREYARLYAFLQANGTPEQIAAWHHLTATPELDAQMVTSLTALHDMENADA